MTTACRPRRLTVRGTWKVNDSLRPEGTEGLASSRTVWMAVGRWTREARSRTPVSAASPRCIFLKVSVVEGSWPREFGQRQMAKEEEVDLYIATVKT